MVLEKDYKAEILWESTNDLNPEGIPYFSVKKARGYYVYGERLGVDSIAFILYDKNINKFCLIREAKPPLDELINNDSMMITAFGGSIDSDLEPGIICKIETKEESGYEVMQSNITFVGTTMVSTQMSQLCYLYLVDITNIEKTLLAEYETQETEYTKNSVHWLSYDEVISSSDWKSIFILARAKRQGIL